MKRLSGWDAVLLYSETPMVHMHTLKLAVIALDELGDRHFGVEEFREVIHGRLYKLDPFRYELVDIPFKFHHPMWRENCEVDLEYHIRPFRVDSPGGRRELDDAVGKIASTPLDRSKPLWEMYFIEGLANGRIAVLGKIHHALADGVASANLMARGMDLQSGPADRDSYATDPAPSRSELVRTAFRDHLRQLGRLPGTVRYTTQGLGRVRKSSQKLSPELTRPFTPPPSFMNHMVDGTRKFATATLALADVKQTGKQLGVTINDMVLAISSGALRELLIRHDGAADHPLVGFGASEFRLLPRPHLGKLLHWRHDDVARRTLRSARAGAGRARCGGVRQGNPPPDGTGTGESVVGLLPARSRRGVVPLAGQQGRSEQGAQPADLERARPARARPGRRCAGHRDLFGGSAHHRQRVEHHGVELRRPTQHLGAVRRRHVGGSARTDQGDD